MNQTSSDGHGGSHELLMTGSVLILPFFMACLCFGIVARRSHRALKLPYTVVLLLGGILVGMGVLLNTSFVAHQLFLLPAPFKIELPEITQWRALTRPLDGL
jgi:hypothetical protein